MIIGTADPMRPIGQRPKLLLLALAPLIVLTACADTPPTNAADMPPQSDDLIASGADLYEGNCAECHGSDLRGTDEGPSHLSEIYKPSHHADEAFLLAVIRGSPQHHWPFGDMPPIEGLTADDVTAIVAFVRERQRIEGFEPYPP